MNEFWNARYARDNYVYGTEPNAYFQKEIDKINPAGKVLLPAEGEGRNAVYAAKSGWEVTAFDFSIEGRKKAMSLASQNNVEIDYLIKDYNDVVFGEKSFDLLAVVYVHPLAAHKSAIFDPLISFLKKGGHVIMEVFSKEHIKLQEADPSAGGPKDPERFYSQVEIKELFKGFEIINLEQTVLRLDEGEFHKGESSVIRFTGVKS